MFLSELATLVTAIVVGGGAALVTGYRVWERIRGKHRNMAGKCAYCARSFGEQSLSELYYIGGRTVCAACASRSRARLVRAFAALAGTFAIVGLFAGTLIYFGLRSPHPVAWREVSLILGLLGGGVAATGVVVAKLKRDNRKAHALERGGQPALPAIGEAIDGA